MKQDGEAAKGKTAWSCGLLWFPECNPLPCHYLGARRPLPLPDTEVATWTHGIDDRDKCHFKDERKAHLWICTIHFEGWCMICSTQRQHLPRCTWATSPWSFYCIDHTWQPCHQLQQTAEEPGRTQECWLSVVTHPITGLLNWSYWLLTTLQCIECICSNSLCTLCFCRTLD